MENKKSRHLKKNYHLRFLEKMEKGWILTVKNKHINNWKNDDTMLHSETKVQAWLIWSVESVLIFWWSTNQSSTLFIFSKLNKYVNELQWEAVLIEKIVPPILQGSQENTSEDTTFEDKENTGNKWKHEMLIPLVMKCYYLRAQFWSKKHQKSQLYQN